MDGCRNRSGRYSRDSGRYRKGGMQRLTEPRATKGARRSPGDTLRLQTPPGPTSFRATRRAPLFTRRRRPLLKAATCILALAAFTLIAFGIVGTLSEVDAPAGGAAPAQSTPASEWTRGALPYLYQTDPAWAGAPYAGGTVEENGCGPTCLSMVYVDLTGKTDLDPAGMARYSEERGYVEGDMTSWTLMTDGAAGLGLAYEELPADASAVLAALSQGRPVICSVGPGDFTTTGHFIVLAGADGSGQVTVHDPNSEERSRTTWDIDRILSQCRNLWAFSAA